VIEQVTAVRPGIALRQVAETDELLLLADPARGVRTGPVEWR
jgi:hypothetical protein